MALLRLNILQLRRELSLLQLKAPYDDPAGLCAPSYVGVDAEKNRQCRLYKSVLLARALFSANVRLILLLPCLPVLDGLDILPAFLSADDPMK